MKHQKRIKKASVVLSAAVLTAVSLSGNLLSMRPITAEALSANYTHTGPTRIIDGNQFEIKEYCESNSANADHWLIDQTRNIIFIEDFDGFKQAYISRNGEPSPLHQNNPVYQNNLNNLSLSELKAYSYKRTYDKKWGIEQAGAMCQFERVYDYFKNVHGWAGTDGNNAKLIITMNDPKCASSNSFFNYISIKKETSQNFNAAREVGIIAHEYTHRILQNKLLWTNAELNQKEDGKFYGEAAILDEAYSDILGEFAQESIYHNAPWRVGTRFSKNGKAFRELGMITSYQETGIYTQDVLGETKTHYRRLAAVPDINNLEAHCGAPIIGHAAYLMNIHQIPDTLSEKIWFNSISKLKNYNGYTLKNCRKAVVQSAKEVFNANYSDALTRAKMLIKVHSAFNFAQVYPNSSYKMGDVNNDGEVTVRDAILVGRLEDENNLWTSGTYTPEIIARGDVNYNGVIDESDFNILTRALAYHTTDKL